jgi:hypothetical protein
MMLPFLSVSSIIRRNLVEVAELVPVPDFKSAVTVREYGEVSSILMLSRQNKKTLMECSMRVFTSE